MLLGLPTLRILLSVSWFQIGHDRFKHGIVTAIVEGETNINDVSDI
jgi:hypothetical protein